MDEAGKYGYIDRAGKIVIPCTFDSASSFSEGLAVVNSGGKDYFINKKGERVF